MRPFQPYLRYSKYSYDTWSDSKEEEGGKTNNRTTEDWGKLTLHVGICALQSEEWMNFGSAGGVDGSKYLWRLMRRGILRTEDERRKKRVVELIFWQSVSRISKIDFKVKGMQERGIDWYFAFRSDQMESGLVVCGQEGRGVEKRSKSFVAFTITLASIPLVISRKMILRILDGDVWECFRLWSWISLDLGLANTNYL